MKRFFKHGLFVLLGLMLFIAGCSSESVTPFEMEDITLDQLETMMDDKKSFFLLVERDACPFCSALNAYIDQTKGQYGDVHLYRLDSTDFELYRENEGDMTLISTNNQGQAFLARFPYFLYTPAIYKIVNGQPTSAGIGYDSNRHTISSWGVDSTINWNEAKPVELWTFLEAKPYKGKENSEESTSSKESSHSISTTSPHSTNTSSSKASSHQEVSTESDDAEEGEGVYIEDEDGWFIPDEEEYY